jgi:hypothetical protein
LSVQEKRRKQNRGEETENIISQSLRLEHKSGAVHSISVTMSSDHHEHQQHEDKNPHTPSGKFMEAAALLSHVQNLESKLQDTAATSFGHRKAPELHLCKIPNPEATSASRSNQQNLPVVAMMAVTERCISAQLVKESIGFSGVGAPVEVLVVSEEDAITAVTMIPLERLDLSAGDAWVSLDDEDEDHHHHQQQPSSAPKSLMSGGVVPVTPLSRLAIVVGTKSSRVISVEFSIKPRSMQLLRRNYYVDNQLLTYFEPFPRDRLTPKQQDLPQKSADESRWVRQHHGSNKNKVVVPFAPTGGVTSIVPYSISTKQGSKEEENNAVAQHHLYGTPSADDRIVRRPTHVWIAFGDGTGIRMHHAGFFPSVIEKYTEIYSENNKQQYKDVGIQLPSLEELFGQPLVKWKAHLPILPSSDVSESLSQNQMMVIPIPKYHPTPLAAATNAASPFPTSWNDAYQLGMMNKDSKHGNALDDSFQDAKEDDSTAAGSTKSGKGGNKDQSNKNQDNNDWWKDYEAIVYCKKDFNNSFPTLAFYTSEDQYPGRFQDDLNELLYGSANEEKKSEGGGSNGGNPIAGLIGGIFGIFGGGSGGGDDKDESMEVVDDDGKHEKKDDKEDDFWDPDLPFPNINRRPVDLYAGVEIHDHPRQFTQCIIDPDGKIAALSDTLGRVSLMDLSTKQIIRMWKGYRETWCHWLQIPQEGSTRPSLYLVIHSRQRRVVEVWEMTHGSRVKSMQVGRDAQVIGCRQMSSQGYILTCFIVYSNVPFSNMNQVERIGVSFAAGEQENRVAARTLESSKRTVSAVQAREAANRLNRLQQMLDPTNVECESVDVFRALEDIDSLEDLVICLDKIATSAVLEEEMGVNGSEFQTLAMSSCRQKLDEAIREGGEDSLTNPHVELLAFKLAYYTQLTKAYEVLHKYETSNQLEDVNMEVKQPNSWGLEAAGWTSTYLKVTKRLIDEDIIPPPTEPMMFYEFATCVDGPKKWREAKFDKSNGGYAIYLSDSSRTRRDMVARIFRPFVSDVFSFKVVDQIFESLGMKNNHEYKLKCFGEWFVGLSIKVATKNAVFATNSPSIRWLKGIISDQIDITSEAEDIAPMKSLYRFCRESEDLVRSFWLATLCRQALYEVAVEKEEQSYGHIDSKIVIGSWDSLLRRLRVCLLVSLRLYGSPLGACPISVKAVDKKGNFSPFEWLARDELTMSHKQQEIASLEVACRMSSRAFDPSKSEGDESAHWKAVQRSCLSAALGESEREEHLIGFDDDERLGALHLFLKPHNIEHILTPHRALLLAGKWGRKPGRLDILEDALDAVRAVDIGKHRNVAYAVRLEIWQNHIRPIYRAMLMGFADVPEVSEEIITPLLSDGNWLKNFSKLAASILSLVRDVTIETEEHVNEWSSLVQEDHSTWPPVRDCFMLQRLVSRNKASNQNAIEAHLTFIYALRISNDIGRLVECIPSFYDLFGAGALFSNVEFSDENEEKQHEFMQDSIVAFAKNYHGPSMDCLNMGDIDILADLWDFDMLNVNTLFLLSMYEFGKDAAVDEVLTRSSSLISVQHFVDEGLDIMCRRLNDLLNVHPSKEIKKIMGTLDADVCEWVKEKARSSEPLTNAKFNVKIGSTHLFGLRLLSLAASADISKEERIKIHSLIVLSGTIVKVLESEKGSVTLIGQSPAKTQQQDNLSDVEDEKDEADEQSFSQQKEAEQNEEDSNAKIEESMAQSDNAARQDASRKTQAQVEIEADQQLKETEVAESVASVNAEATSLNDISSAEADFKDISSVES